MMNEWMNEWFYEWMMMNEWMIEVNKLVPVGWVKVVDKLEIDRAEEAGFVRRLFVSRLMVLEKILEMKSWQVVAGKE